jgi:2-methylcitrate dehydratase PrpD
MIKRFNLGRGTFNGMYAVQLVSAGYTGVEDILEREVGSFIRAYADDGDLTVLTDGLGQEFETLKVELKPYVSSRPNHTAIDATLELRRRHPALTVDKIDRIEIEVGTVNYEWGAGFPVVDVPSAVMSVAYCAAVALLDGEAFLDQFTQERVNDPRCQQLLNNTEVFCNKQIDGMGLEDRDHTVVRWRLKGGRVVEVARTYAKGHPSCPMTEAEVRTKFHRLVDQRIEQRRASALEDAFGRLAEVDSQQIGSLLCV